MAKEAGLLHLEHYYAHQVRYFIKITPANFSSSGSPLFNSKDESF